MVMGEVWNLCSAGSRWPRLRALAFPASRASGEGHVWRRSVLHCYPLLDLYDVPTTSS